MLPPQQQANARLIQATVLKADDELEQAVKWGNLVFQYEGWNALAIVAHKSHLNLQVFNGASLMKEFPELEGSGKGLRHLRIRNSQEVDTHLIHELVLACLDAMDDAREEAQGPDDAAPPP